MLLWATLIYYVAVSQPLCYADTNKSRNPNETGPDLTPEMKNLLGLISEQNLADMDHESNMTKVMNAIRSNAEEGPFWPLKRDTLMLDFNPEYENAGKACITLQTTYRRAFRDLRRYFQIRETYVNTLEYEVGYITQVIITKYINMLELYEIITNRLFNLTEEEREASKERYAPLSFVWWMYVNMIEYSRTIMQHCNMLHEIEAKYENPVKGTWIDDEELVKNMEAGGDGMSPDDEKFQEAYKRYEKKKALQQRKLKKQAKERQKMIDKFGFTESTPRSKRPVRHWFKQEDGLDYGWSIEDF